MAGLRGLYGGGLDARMRKAMEAAGVPEPPLKNGKKKKQMKKTAVKPRK